MKNVVLGPGLWDKSSLCVSVNKKLKTTLMQNVMKARGRKEKERGRREVEMLKSIDSNFVIRFVDAFEGRSEVNLS